MTNLGARRKVRVGDVVFHSWKCSYGAHDSSMYCLMVNNCTVSGEQDKCNRVPILDEFRCSLLPNILPHVEYPSVGQDTPSAITAAQVRP
ncbi:hypothetical protein Q1695_013097 [Nippostrongylus brasiliensis]|nr:hypothetical protein Q1695_013097 [Nippostrongylus brasiliensis]